MLIVEGENFYDKNKCTDWLSLLGDLQILKSTQQETKEFVIIENTLVSWWVDFRVCETMIKVIILLYTLAV